MQHTDNEKREKKSEGVLVRAGLLGSLFSLMVMAIF